MCARARELEKMETIVDRSERPPTESEMLEVLMSKKGCFEPKHIIECIGSLVRRRDLRSIRRDWLCGAATLWLSRVCGTKSPCRKLLPSSETFPGQDGSCAVRFWTCIRDVLTFLVTERSQSQLPLSVGRTLLKSAIATTRSQILLPIRASRDVYAALTDGDIPMYQPSLEESAQLIASLVDECEDEEDASAIGDARLELLRTAIGGHRTVVARHPNRRKCFVSTMASPLLPALLRATCAANASGTVAKHAELLLSDVVSHRDILDGVVSACTTARKRLDDVASAKAPTRKRKRNSGAKTKSSIGFQRRLFERLRGFLRDPSTDATLRDAAAMSLAIFQRTMGGRLDGASAESTGSRVPLAFVLFLELVSILRPVVDAPLGRRALASLIRAFAETAPVAAAFFRRSDDVATTMRTVTGPLVKGIATALPCPFAIDCLRACLKLTHLLVEPHLGDCMTIVVRSALSDVASSRSARELCCALLDTYARLRQIDAWLRIVADAATSDVVAPVSPFGHAYDVALASALSKCSESQLPAAIDALETHLIRGNAVAVHAFRMLAANAHVSSLRANEMRERCENLARSLERVEESAANDVVAARRLLGRGLRTLVDRCAVHLGIDPLVSAEAFESDACLRLPDASNLILTAHDPKSADPEDVRTVVLRLSHLRRAGLVDRSKDEIDTLLRWLWSSLLAPATESAARRRWTLAIDRFGDVCALTVATRSLRRTYEIFDGVARELISGLDTVLFRSAEFFEIEIVRERVSATALARVRELTARAFEDEGNVETIDELARLLRLVGSFPPGYLDDADESLFDAITIAESKAADVHRRRNTTPAQRASCVRTVVNARAYCLSRPNPMLSFLARSHDAWSAVSRDVVDASIRELTSKCLRASAREGAVADDAEPRLRSLFAAALESATDANDLASIVRGISDGVTTKAQRKMDVRNDVARGRTVETSSVFAGPVVTPALCALLDRAAVVATTTTTTDASLSLYASLVSVRWNVALDGASSGEHADDTLLSHMLPMMAAASRRLLKRTTDLDESATAAARLLAVVCRTHRHLERGLDLDDVRTLVATVLGALARANVREKPDEESATSYLKRAIVNLYRTSSPDQLRVLLGALRDELDVGDSARRLVGATCLVSVYRAPMPSGDRRFVATDAALPLLRRLRRSSLRSEDMRRASLEFATALLCRPRALRLSANEVALCALVANVPESASKHYKRTAGLVVAAAQHRPRQTCCCMPPFVATIVRLLRVALTDETDAPERARHFQRVCELMSEDPIRTAFRHHVAHVLATYVTLVVERTEALGPELESALTPSVGYMLGICSRYELQQLHIALDAPKRALLKTLHKKFLKHQKYSGNV